MDEKKNYTKCYSQVAHSGDLGISISVKSLLIAFCISLVPFIDQA